MSDNRREDPEPGLAKSTDTDNGAAPSSTQALGAIKLSQKKTGGGGGLKNIQITIPSASVAAKLPQNIAAVETIDRERRRGPTEEEIAQAIEHAAVGAQLLEGGDHTVALEHYNLAVQQDPTSMDHQVGHTWATYVCGLTRASSAERRLQNLLKDVDPGNYEFRSRILCYQAEIVRTAGERDRSHDLFGQAKAADPNNGQAARGFESTFPVAATKEEVGGWISRIFKRNK